ncbi:MAG: PAS domain-containing protein, partial [Bacteroidota bacterium]
MSGNFSLTQVKEWLIENLPYKIMWMDEEGRIVYANVKFLERLGYHPSEITHLTIFDINPHTNKEGWKDHWQEVKSKEIHRFKAVHQTKQGNYYDVEVYSQFFSNNGKDVICAIVNEISESSFYKNLLNHTERITMVGGWKYNLQDESIVVTKQAKCIFDTDSTKNFHPANVISFFDEKEALKKHMDEALTNGVPYDEILTLRLKGDVVKYVRCVGEPVIKGKKIYKLIGAYQDVTE